MKLHKNWHYLVVLLLMASFLLVACERPLPGGYNDPEAGTDTTLPEVPEDVPGIDSESYPSEEAPAAPEEAAPEDAADAAEAYPAEEQEPAAEGEETAPESEAEADVEAPAEEAPVDEAAAEEAGAEEAAEAEEAPAEEAAGEETAEETADAEETVVEETADTPGTHTVAEGENLYRIGLLYGISWLDLAEANDIVDPANLSVGQVLTIPGADALAEETVEGEEAVVEEPAAEEAEAVEETSEEAAVDEAAAAVETTEEAAPEEEAAVEESAAADGTRTYIVQAGDNLFRIGLNHGVDWTEIAALNGIVNAEIHPGMELIIPAAAADVEAEVEASGETEADAGAQEAEAGGETTYVVQEGDTIYSVAFEHGIPWTAIVESNDIEAPYTLEVGQELIIIVPASEE